MWKGMVSYRASSCVLLSHGSWDSAGILHWQSPCSPSERGVPKIRHCWTTMKLLLVPPCCHHTLFFKKKIFPAVHISHALHCFICRKQTPGLLQQLCSVLGQVLKLSIVPAVKQRKTTGWGADLQLVRSLLTRAFWCPQQNQRAVGSGDGVVPQNSGSWENSSIHSSCE